jgi:hypothetical protein
MRQAQNEMQYAMRELQHKQNIISFKDKPIPVTGTEGP